MSGEPTSALGMDAEDLVTNDFVNAISNRVVDEVGGSSLFLRDYSWAGDDDDGSWPFVVVRDGREFEVDIDVRVTELTPERKAAREAESERLLAMLFLRRGLGPEARP